MEMQAERAVTFKSMFEAILEHNKELMQGSVVRIESPAKAQSRLDEPWIAYTCKILVKIMEWWGSDKQSPYKVKLTR